MARGERQNLMIEQIAPEKPADANFDAIHLRADIRRREQMLKMEMMNIRQPWATEAMRAAEERIRSLIIAEAKGGAQISSDKTEDDLLKEAAILQEKAEEANDLFPNLAAYHLARAAKLRLATGCNIGVELETIKQVKIRPTEKQNTAAANLLPDAILLGLQRKLTEQASMPSKEQVASSAGDDRTLLADYALVLPEKERPEFLALIPDEQRREVAVLLDRSVSQVLHHSIIEKGTEEDKQRKEVRLRVYKELKQVLADSQKSDKKIAAALAQAMGKLGGDARLLLLELVRDEVEAGGLGKEKEQEYLPHALGILMNEFDDYRVNDIALQLVGDPRLAEPVRRSLLQKLVKRGYLSKDVGEWWAEKSESSGRGIEQLQNRGKRLELLQKVITDLGVVPSKDVLEFLDDNKRWGKSTLAERVEKIRASQTEFSRVKTQKDLIDILGRDEQKAMVYYILHGGEDRFNLINNYSFEKFKEMIKLIADLRVHSEPIKKFEEALQNSGMGSYQIRDIITRLNAGHFPLAQGEQARQEVSFEVSENAPVKNANAEIGRVLGREQLGIVLLFPLYREYLEQESGNDAKTILQKMSVAQTFADRLAIISEFESARPEWRQKAKTELEENWRALGEKMVLEMTLDQVLAENNVPIRGEELIPRLNAKRLDLKRMKKDLLVALKGGNEKLDKLRSDLYKKRRARGQLTIGLEKQTDERKRVDLQVKVDALNREIADLEVQTAVATDAKVSDRYAHLAPEKKQEEMEKVGREIIALTEKSPSAIFTYLTLQVLGEERLREHDIQLIQEMESHLQGPFQTIADHLTYQPTGRDGGNKKSTRVDLRYVDKAERLMNMVRFADSKICCFSSCNYEMKVQHDTPNKYWVASINADPMSFVISMEVPQGENPEEENKRKTSENLGFIFGSFALDKEGKPAIMLNGIYYAPGIEDSNQVEIILAGVQKLFVGLPINSTAIASQYGGAVKMPEGYTNTAAEFTRLRALDSGDGTPETKVYDDIGTDSSLNHAKVYNAGGSGNLWHQTTQKNKIK